MDIDFDTLTQTAKFAGNMGSAANSIAGALKTVTTLFDKTEGGADPDIKRAMSQLTLEVANAQRTSAELLFQLTTLDHQLRELQAFNSDLNRYFLHKTTAGDLVYSLHAAKANGEPLHYLCPNCVEQKRKSILQGGNHTKTCHPCGASFDIEPRPPTPRRDLKGIA